MRFFTGGGVASIRLSVSSRPIPGSSLGSPLGEFCGGLGFDGFPGFVALNLGSVGQALALDALEDGRGALNVVDAARDRRITPDEVKRIVRWLGYRTGEKPRTKNQEVALAFLIALRTGMRAGEILSLSDANVDLVRRVARVQHKMQHLTGRPREIPLFRAAVRLLTPVMGNGPVFSITSASLDTLFRKARDSLGIKGLRFHDTRGEALTRFARRVDALTLAKISGHKDLRILMDHYYRETAADIAARL